MMKLRYKREAGGRGIMILETEPAGRSIFTYRQSAGTIWLPFPYLLHIVQYTTSGGNYIYGGIYDKGLLVFCRNSPLETIDDTVYHSPTDLERGGLVCTPHHYDRKSYSSSEALVESVITLWWNTYHNISPDTISKWQFKNLESVLKMGWGTGFKLRNAIDKDYYSQFGYGMAGTPLPKDAELIDEPFLQRSEVAV